MSPVKREQIGRAFAQLAGRLQPGRSGSVAVATTTVHSAADRWGFAPGDGRCGRRAGLPPLRAGVRAGVDRPGFAGRRVVLLAVTAERFFGCAVGARQRICLALTAGGLVLIVATLPGTSGRGDGVAPAGLLGFQATLLVVAGALVAGTGGRDPTAHATLLSTILDVLAGSSRAAEAPPPLLGPLSDAEHPNRDLLRRREGCIRRLTPWPPTDASLTCPCLR